jgi:hypothetical protein
MQGGLMDAPKKEAEEMLLCLVIVGCSPNRDEAREFKPSQVFIDEIPFVDTFNHLEAEVTGAVIVKALALRGDCWRMIECKDLAEVFEELTANENMWHRLFQNPFVKVDMHDLVNRGFARWRDNGKAIEFTITGLDRLKKWVVK